MKLFLLPLVLLIACSQVATSRRESDRQHDEFVGPVKKVVVVWSPISGSNYPVGSRCRERTDEYDESGRLTRHSLYPGSCGNDEIREDYSYSVDGIRSTTRKEIRAPGSPPPPPSAAGRSNDGEAPNGQPREVFKYDSSGRRVEVRMVKPSGRVSYKVTYRYDEKGRLIESNVYDGDSTTLEARRVYKFSSGEQVPTEFAYYGPDGRIYEKSTYTDYEFNSTGDWIKRKETREQTFNRHSVSMTFREIEYYSEGK